MIKITLIYRQAELIGLSLQGHADDADEGQSLVCAGVSTCFIGALNALSEPDNFQITYEKGNGLVQALGDVNAHDKTVLEVLKVQLETIEESYNDFIHIITERRKL